MKTSSSPALTTLGWKIEKVNPRLHECVIHRMLLLNKEDIEKYPNAMRLQKASNDEAMDLLRVPVNGKRESWRGVSHRSEKRPDRPWQNGFQSRAPG